MELGEFPPERCPLLNTARSFSAEKAEVFNTISVLSVGKSQLVQPHPSVIMNTLHTNSSSAQQLLNLPLKLLFKAARLEHLHTRVAEELAQERSGRCQ